jgi:hypothetical protein
VLADASAPRLREARCMSYSPEWAVGPAILGVLLLPLVAPIFGLLALLVVALAAAAALVALAGAILATPYLVVRTVRRRAADRHPGLIALEPTTARSSL